MKKILVFVSLAGYLLFLTSCPAGYRYDEGRFPASPVNLTKINSEYDDYNSTSPVIESERYLFFSSDRNSQGAEFDIVGDHFHVLWDRDDGSLLVDNAKNSWRDFRYADTLFSMVNTPFNEFGPYSLPYLTYDEMSGYHYTDLLIFSNDESGKQDIKIAWFEGTGENPAPGDGEYGGPLPVTFLNSAYNDAYLSFYGSNYFQTDWGSDPEMISEIMFCSDREGDFDIYQVDVTVNTAILDFLKLDTILPVKPLEVLNSAYQDKSPYINGELLVFASDRPGGFGGFDLYYSQRTGDEWSAPVNFGSMINTEHNEFRPIVALYDEFENDLMIFSSDRPGGKGGYDLYYAGINKMIAVY